MELVLAVVVPFNRFISKYSAHYFVLFYHMLTTKPEPLPLGGLSRSSSVFHETSLAGSLAIVSGTCNVFQLGGEIRLLQQVGLRLVFMAI